MATAVAATAAGAAAPAAAAVKASAAGAAAAVVAAGVYMRREAHLIRRDALIMVCVELRENAVENTLHKHLRFLIVVQRVVGVHHPIHLHLNLV